MTKKEKNKSFYDIEFEEQIKDRWKEENSEVKNTFLNRIENNIWLFFLMLIWVISIFLLLSNFYHWDRVYGFYTPFAFTVDWIFSNNWMFISSALYSTVWICFIMYLFFKKFIKEDKLRTNKWYYKMTILATLCVYILFYVTNPWYTFQTHPRVFMYQDWKNITNKEIYFFLTERYGFKWDLYKPFKTIDDSIAGLEFAMRVNESWLYESIFYDLEKFGYKDVLEQYKDKTFQTYFLRKITHINTNYQNEKNFFINNSKNLDYIEERGLDKILRDIASFTKQEYIKFTNLSIDEKTFFNTINSYWDSIYIIKWINHNMFIQSDIIEYKKNEKGDWNLIDKKIKY